MRIKEFRIYRYGPLIDSNRIVLGDFNLFYGMNEEGKSLTIDAIVKFLFPKKSSRRVFKWIERVEDIPEGYIIVDHEGDETKFPQAGDITELADFSPQEWRNIFIIRNSDLSISEAERFYTNVTDRLTGLKTEEIMSVKNILKDIGRLTRADSSARLSDSESADKLASRVDDASELIGKIDALKSKAEEEELDIIEKEIECAKKELERIDSEISSLEDALQREKYEKGLKALEELKNSLNEFEKLSVYNEDEERKFRDLERDVHISSEEIEGLSNEVKAKGNELVLVKKSTEDANRELGIMKDRDDKIEREKVDITRCKELSQEYIKLSARRRLRDILMLIFSPLMAISLLGLIFGSAKIFLPLFILFLTIFSYPLTELFISYIKRSNLSRLFEKIRLNLSSIDISSDSIEGILSLIQRFEEEIGDREKKVRSLEGEKDLLEREIIRLKEKIRDYENKRRGYERSIEDIKRASRIEGLKEYRERLHRKQEVEKIYSEQAGFLKSLFGTGGIGDKKELLDFWGRAISELNIYRDKSKDVEYSKLREKELKQKREALMGKRGEALDRYSGWQDTLKQIEREAGEILKEDLCCNTLGELGYIERRLQDFKRDTDTNMENVLDVMRIFEDIEKEEESKITRLFGKNSKASKHFARITDGRYPSVDIDTEQKTVFVVTSDGLKIDVGKLSGGTYDQLYLSIRLALGEELLKSGFFIMDDPFVKSDFERLINQLDILKKIAERGWQILYFTAKDEVKETLKNDIASKEVQFIESNWVGL